MIKIRYIEQLCLRERNKLKDFIYAKSSNPTIVGAIRLNTKNLATQSFERDWRKKTRKKQDISKIEEKIILLSDTKFAKNRCLNFIFSTF